MNTKQRPEILEMLHKKSRMLRRALGYAGEMGDLDYIIYDLERGAPQRECDIILFAGIKFRIHKSKTPELMNWMTKESMIFSINTFTLQEYQ